MQRENRIVRTQRDISFVDRNFLLYKVLGFEPSFVSHVRLDCIYMLRAMMELTMSLSFSLRALTAFFLLTEAWAMTSSMSLASRPVSSTSSPSSSSSSSFLASTSGALPLSEWSWVCSAAPSCWESCWAAAAWACEFRSSILASPKMLHCVLVTVVG